MTALAGMLTFVKMLMGFLIAKVVAVNTGPVGMALLGQIQGITSGLTGVVNSPSSVAVVRYTAEYYDEGPEKCSPWWRACTFWTLSLLGVICPVGIYFSERLSLWLFNDNQYQWLMIVLIVFLPVSAFGNMMNSVVNGQQNYKKYISLGAISTMASSAIMILLIYKYKINGALIASAIQAGIIGLIMIAACAHEKWFKIRFWLGSVGIKEKKKIGLYILMSLISAISMPLTLIIVRKILVEKVGWVATGQWQAVWKISEAYLGIITIALGTYFLPKLSVLQSMSEIKSETHKVARVIIPLVSVLALVIFLLRDIVITILFTDEFRGARDLFLIQLTGDVIKIISWLYSYSLLSKGHAKPYILLEMLYTFSFIIGAYFLIPAFGVSGANYAYCISYCLYLIAVLFIINFGCFKKI